MDKGGRRERRGRGKGGWEGERKRERECSFVYYLIENRPSFLRGDFQVFGFDVTYRRFVRLLLVVGHRVGPFVILTNVWRSRRKRQDDEKRRERKHERRHAKRLGPARAQYLLSRSCLAPSPTSLFLA